MTNLQFEGVCRGHFATRHFPFKDETDYETESREYLAFVVEKLHQCLFSKEINEDLFIALRGINRYCNDVVRFDIDEGTFAHIVKALWSFAFETEELGTKWLRRILTTLNALLERSFLFSTDCMVLPWRPAFAVFKESYWLPRRLPDKKNEKSQKALRMALIWAKRFFSKESPVEIYNEARPFLCGFDTSLSFGLDMLHHFLPLDIRARARQSQHFLHFQHELLDLWHFLRLGNTFDISIRLLKDIIAGGIGCYDPKPYRTIVFRETLSRVRSGGGGRQVIMYDDPLAFSFVFLCRPADEDFWTMATDLMHILKPLMHPSMSSSSQVAAFSFVVGSISALAQRRTIESKPLVNFPAEAKLTHEDYAKFVTLFSDVIFMGLNSKSKTVVDVISYSTQQLAKLAPETFLPLVAANIIENLQSEENHRVLAVLSLLQSVSLYLFSPMFFPSGDQYLLPVLEAMLPCIDPNDSVKTSLAFRCYISIFSAVVFVDCSQNIPPSATDEEVDVLDATGLLSQWCMDFLDAVFRYSEDVGGRIGSVNGAAAGCLRVFFSQLSPAICKKAIAKTAQWVLTSSDFHAQIPSHLCKGAAIADPKTTVSLLIEPITQRILEQAQNLPSYDDEKTEIVKRDHVLNYYLNLFLHILIVPYKGITAHQDLIVRVFTVLFNMRSRKSTSMASDALERFLGSLTTVRLLDSRSVGAAVWESIESDPCAVFRTRYLSDQPSFEAAMEEVWQHSSCTPLLEGALDLDWVVPTDEQLQLAQVLVERILDPAQAFIRQCTQETAGDAIDEDRLRMSVHIVGRFAQSTVVAPFTTHEAQKENVFLPFTKMFTLDASSAAPVDAAESNTRTGSGVLGADASQAVPASRRKSMIADVRALLKWLLQHRTSDNVTINGCIRAAQFVMLGSKLSAGLKNDAIFGRNISWLLPTRGSFAAIVDSAYLRRMERAQQRILEYQDDTSLVDVLVECLTSRYDTIRNSAVELLGRWVGYQNNVRRFAFIDNVLALWSSAPNIADFDDAKVVILGCMGALVNKHTLPHVCRSYPRVKRVMEAASACLSVSDDQLLFDSLNAAVEAVISNLVLFVRPSPLPPSVLEHMTRAYVRACKGSSRDPGTPDDSAALKIKIDRAIVEVGQVLKEYGDQLVREGQEIILYCLHAFDLVQSASWKVKVWFARMMTVLLLEKHYLHPNAIHFLLFYMTSGIPQLRVLCRGAVAIILYYLKVKPKKITVRIDPGGKGPIRVDGDRGSDGSDVADALSAGFAGSTATFRGVGRRADNEWIMPRVVDNAFPLPGPDHIYVDKPFLGWLAWPITFKTYAPESEQDFSHLPGRHEAPATPAMPGSPIVSVPHSPDQGPGSGLSSPLPLARRWSDGFGFAIPPTANTSKTAPTSGPQEAATDSNTSNSDDAALARTASEDAEVVAEVLSRGASVSADKLQRALSSVASQHDEVYLDNKAAITRCRNVCESMFLDSAFMAELANQLITDTTALLYSSMSQFIKGIARTFGIAAVRNMFPALENAPEKHLPRTHRRIAGIVSGMVRGAKHWPSEDRAALWAFLESFLPALWLDIPSGAFKAWSACVVESVCEHDPIRAHHFANLLLRLNYGPDTLQYTALQQSTFLELLNSLLTELSWRGYHLASYVLGMSAQNLDSSLHLVRKAVGGLISSCFTSLYTTKNEEPFLIDFMTSLVAPLREQVDRAAEELDEASTKRAKMVLSILASCSGDYGVMVLLKYVLPHYGVLLPLPEMVTDHEFTRHLPRTIASISAHSTEPTVADALCGLVASQSWHSKVRVLRLLPSVAWRLLPERHDGVLATVVEYLADEHIEVQHAAKAALTGLCQSGLIADMHALIETFKQWAHTKVRRVKRKKINQREMLPENMPHTAEEREALRRRHSGVLGLSALIVAHPYDEPEWLLPTLLALVPHCHDIEQIRRTANKTMSEFWRTHKETWHLSKEKLTPDEQEELNNVLISPSYYA